jgi:hypothetical protein
MRNRSIRVAWILSGTLVVVGSMLVVVFPQPFITYYCSSYACPAETSGGFSVGYVVIFFGVVAAFVAGCMSLVSMLRRSASHN